MIPRALPRHGFLRAAGRLLALALVLAGTPAAAQDGANADAGPGAATGLPLDTGQPAAEVSEAERTGQQPSLTSDPEWEQVADRAERVLEAGRASNVTLEQLRAELAEWRAKFQQAQSANATRIATLRAQIAALGAAPAEGQTEAPEIALRRRELEDTLRRLEAPRLAADESYSRADALIRGIDALIRERQANEILKLGPTPLNPANWTAALRQVRATAAATWRETSAAWDSPAQRTAARAALPLVLGLMALALVSLLRLPRWLGLAARRLSAGRSPQAAAVIDFLKSVLHLAVAVVGVAALHEALTATGLFGYRGSILVDGLAALGVMLALTGWLSGRFFPRGAEADDFLHLPQARRAEGRLFSLVLGAALWWLAIVRIFAEAEGWSEPTRAILQFPGLVVAGLSLFRIGQIVTFRPALPEGAPVPQAEFRRSLILTIGRTVSAVGLAGPVLAGIGYLSAASFLTLPAAESLALLALLVLLQGFFTQVYGLVTRRQGAELDSALVPVLAGILLGLVSLPLFALVWGARTADLTELWLTAKEGFAFGGTRISPGMFLTFVLVFLLGYAATRLLQGTLRNAVLPKTRLDPGGQTAVVSGIGYLGIFLSALFAINSTGVSLTSLAVVFGALSVGIGFGLQNIVQNFVSGIIMLVERPVAVGDWIEVGGNQGIVREIAVRSTRIETFDKTSVIVPNANFISGVVTNYTRDSLAGRITIPVGVAHGSDTRRVEAILRGIVEAHPLVKLEPPPSVTFEDFGADALMFVIRAILPNVNFGGAVKTELRHEILRRFAEEGIEIPHARRDISLRNPEALAAALVQAGGAARLTPSAFPAASAPPAPAPAGPAPAEPAAAGDRGARAADNDGYEDEDEERR